MICLKEAVERRSTEYSITYLSNTPWKLSTFSFFFFVFQKPLGLLFYIFIFFSNFPCCVLLRVMKATAIFFLFVIFIHMEILNLYEKNETWLKIFFFLPGLCVIGHLNWLHCANVNIIHNLNIYIFLNVFEL